MIKDVFRIAWYITYTLFCRLFNKKQLKINKANNTRLISPSPPGVPAALPQTIDDDRGGVYNTRGSGYQPRPGPRTNPPRGRSGVVGSNPRRNQPNPYIDENDPDSQHLRTDDEQRGAGRDEYDWARSFDDLPKSKKEIEEGVICTDFSGRKWKKVNGKRVYLDLYDKADRIDELIIEDD